MTNLIFIQQKIDSFSLTWNENKDENVNVIKSISVVLYKFQWIKVINFDEKKRKRHYFFNLIIQFLFLRRLGIICLLFSFCQVQMPKSLNSKSLKVYWKSIQGHVVLKSFQMDKTMGKNYSSKKPILGDFKIVWK